MTDVLLPYRGDEGLMRLAVASVLAQDVEDWQLHVLDDSGGATSWLGELASRDPRVHVVVAQERHGVNRAFRRCLTLGTADLVTFMGCDDVMRPDHLRHLRELAVRHPGAAMLQPGVEVVDGQGRPALPLGDRVKRRLRPVGERELGGEDLAVSLLHGNWLYFPSLAWRRAALEAHPFRPGLETVLDLALELDLVLDGESLVVSDHVTFEYRRHAASASSTTARSAERFEEGRRFFTDTERRCRDLGWRRAARAARLHLTTRAHTALTAGSSLSDGDVRLALRLARLAAA